MDYEAFIRAKRASVPQLGFPPPPAPEVLFPFQRDIFRWLLTMGRAGLFASFGLGKTLVQLAVGRAVCEHTGGRFIIVAPLGVRQEFARDAKLLGVDLAFIRRTEEAGPTGVYLTNYESVRDANPDGSRKLDPRAFDGASLDEASCLRGFGGTKTFREFMALFAGDDRRDMSQRVVTEGVRYRFVATATPSPNDYIELLAYAAFLGVMDVSAAKTRFFARNSELQDDLTLLPHKEAEFWRWVSSWAVFVTKPSDVNPSYSDDGYELPELDVRWHEIPTDHLAGAGHEKDGQARLFRDASLGVRETAREKRDSLAGRVAKLMEIRAEDPGAHRVIWHDLEAEREAVERAVPSLRSVYGSQPLDEREAVIVDFSDGAVQELAAKPSMLGSGCNFQRNCAWAVYLGIGFKFNDWIQSVHRVHRFLQKRRVRVDLIYTEAERGVREALERKWAQHRVMVQKMTDIVRENGLGMSREAGAGARSMDVHRVEVRGERFTSVNNDCVEETRRMADGSVHLVVTSIPFSTQYEYSPSYRDFGHTDTNEHFFEQMDYLVPELLRVLQPGRVCVIHVKDRVVPGGMKGLGFQTIYPFHCDVIARFQRHGFAFIAQKTIVTDVVRENKQTNRLGWSEQCKDGSRMGAGLPEYLLIFRRPPTDPANGYADVPVAKDKAAYTRPRWQFDAHGFMRSSGDRPVAPEDFDGLPYDQVFKLFKRHSLVDLYDFATDVKIAERLADRGMLPAGFMLLQPQSWHEDVWTDVTRMRTLNMTQAQKGLTQHLCPMQFDIADRCIEQYSMKGETVYDPFAGLHTVPVRAVRLGRVGVGCELSPAYWRDGVAYCKAEERAVTTPTLFDLMEAVREKAPEVDEAAAVAAEASAEAPAPAPGVVAPPVKARRPRKSASKEAA